jgi:hypothetical protein
MKPLTAMSPIGRHFSDLPTPQTNVGYQGKDGVIGRPSLWIAEDFGCCASG